jgi:cell wall assembly regulator SMI1
MTAFYAQLWQNWINAITQFVPKENKFFNLVDGITEADITTLQMKKNRKIPWTLPKSLIDFYKIHNVKGYSQFDSVFIFDIRSEDYSYQLYPFDRLVELYGNMLWIQSDGDEAYIPDEALPEEVQSIHRLNHFWIPFATTGDGDYLVFDTDPTTKGTFGQIIEVTCESAETNIIAHSLEELLQIQIAKLPDSGQKLYEWYIERDAEEDE